MATYTGENVTDLDVLTPTEGATPPSEVNNSDREIKRVFKNQYAIVTKTADYTLDAQDAVVLINGSGLTITIPEGSTVAGSGFKKVYTLKNIHASASATIARTGSDTFDGAASLTLLAGEAIALISDGSAAWQTDRPVFGTAANTSCEGDDARLSDTRTPSAHDLAGAKHNAGTLAALNTKVSDATLDDSGSTRTPTAHESTHEPLGSDPLLLDEDDMTSDSATKGTSQQAAKKYTDEHAVQSKVLNFTRSAAAGSGDQAITGAGFTPTSVEIFTAHDGNTDMVSMGWGDSSLGERCLYNSGGASASWGPGSARIIFISTDDGNSMAGVLKTLDADGFTITWTKAGSGKDTSCEAIAYR